MPTVNVRSIAALEELQGGLARYGDQAQAALDAAQRETQRTLDWLDERVRHWRNEVARCQEQERRALAVYQRCLASGTRERPAYCGAEEQAVAEARRRLAAAQQEERMATQARQAVQAAAEAYLREAGRLRVMLQSDTPKAVATLRHKVEALRSYAGGANADSLAVGALAFGAGVAIGAALGAAASLSESNLGIVSTTPRAAMKARFGGDAQELENFYRVALQQLEETNAGQALLSALPTGTSIERLIETDLRGQHIDLLGYVAGCAARGNDKLSNAEIGSLVHRIVELRTLYLHPDEVLDGTRLVEQPIILIEDDARVEIDDITKRGDRYHLRDYKPVNMAEFVTTLAGECWKAHVESQTGVSCAEYISAGRNPFVNDPPPEVHSALRNWLDREKSRRDAQLPRYKQAFLSAHPALQEDQVRTQVRPYFVYR